MSARVTGRAHTRVRYSAPASVPGVGAPSRGARIVVTGVGHNRRPVYVPATLVDASIVTTPNAALEDQAATLTNTGHHRCVIQTAAVTPTVRTMTYTASNPTVITTGG